MIITRDAHRRALGRLLRRVPVVALLGARQVGKTTLARQLAAAYAGPTTLFDLERAEDLARLAEPALALGPLRGLVVIDEIQRRPDLFTTLRVLVDEPQPRRRYLVLGSAAPALLQQSAESLAGRIAYHELDGFSLDEVGADRWARRWRRGGFPRSFLAASDRDSLRWRQELIRTYVERDLPALGLRLPAPTLRRFWMMLAHYHGQTWNSSALARSFGVAHTTVQRYLDILTETFMVRQLQSWHQNVGKRQVKAPTIYIRDSGLLHALLGLGTSRDIESHPTLGASWEGFALEAVVAHIRARPEECFCWATHGGAALDLLVVRGGRRVGFEFKRTAAPAITKSMRIAMDDLHVSQLFVVHAGQQSFALDKRITAVAMERILEDLEPLH
jgi:predicted AAA+ superfamily ATPase